MDISLENVGKRYRFEWIFKGINYTFQSGQKYAILGSNGSGKSTLMKILSGHLTPSKGTIKFSSSTGDFSRSNIYKEVSFAAPYMELIEEFSLREAIVFHQKFKPFLNDKSIDDIITILDLPKSAQSKELRFFSSGMKQRVKLGLAILSTSSMLLLDEPTTNLDKKGMEWYLEMIEDYGGNRTIIIASNEERDYAFCENHFSILDYKPKRKKR